MPATALYKGDVMGWLYEGIVADCNTQYCKINLHVQRTGYLQKRLSQGNGLDLFGRLANCDSRSRRPGSLILLF